MSDWDLPHATSWSVWPIFHSPVTFYSSNTLQFHWEGAVQASYAVLWQLLFNMYWFDKHQAVCTLKVQADEHQHYPRVARAFLSRVPWPKHPFKPPSIYYWPFQGDTSVVVYSNCHCSSTFCLVFDFLWDLFRIAWWSSVGKMLSSWHSACAVLLYSVLFVFLSHWMSGIECWIWLYRFLVIAFSSTPAGIYTLMCIKWASAWQNQQNDLCTQRRLRSAWASAQSDQSLHYLYDEALGP